MFSVAKSICEKFLREESKICFTEKVVSMTSGREGVCMVPFLLNYLISISMHQTFEPPRFSKILSIPSLTSLCRPRRLKGLVTLFAKF